MLALKIYILDESMRLRMKDHYGSHQECIFALSPFGILLNNPLRAPLILSDGTVSLDAHRKWLQNRKSVEQALTTSLQSGMNFGENDIIVPRRFDVLHGRGSRYAKHTGNLRLVHLCNMKLGSYNDANKYQKVSQSMQAVSSSSKMAH